ncbi:MAG: hypothetical protein AABX96_03725 [Nanoarchaeota archaeon]
MPAPQRNIESIADNYVDGALRRYENGSFALFKYGCRIYAGVSQPLAVLGGRVLMRMIKIQQPPPDILVEPLKRRCRDIVLEVDESIEFTERDLFYARLHNGLLSRLNLEEQRHLVAKGIF